MCQAGLKRFQSTLPTRGSDFLSVTAAISAKISIHAPHEGERRWRGGGLRQSPRFQSTLPTRGSDAVRERHTEPDDHFNPRSPRGGATTGFTLTLLPAALFQSTLPTRGSDTNGEKYCIVVAHFNPRSPRGGATPSMIGRLKDTA